MFMKIGDIKSLLELHVDTKHWDEVGQSTYLVKVISVLKLSDQKAQYGKVKILFSYYLSIPICYSKQLR